MDSDGSLTLLLAGLLSLLVVLVLSPDQRLVFVLLTDLPLLLADLGGIDERAVGLEGALGDLLAARATPVNTPSNCR